MERTGKRRPSNSNETEAIEQFVGEFRWLSNFWPVEVDFNREVYRSVEHAYQAAKTKDRFERQMIQEAQSAGHAKRLGSKLTVRDDWEAMKMKVMEELLRQNFAHAEMREKLMATGDVQLIEGNSWGDRYWGFDNGDGENRLGKLIMKIRSEIARETNS